jgi:uncharacterized protein YbcI
MNIDSDQQSGDGAAWPAHQEPRLAHPEPETLEPARSPMLELANAMVRLYKEAFGRGPTKARAMLAGPDTLVVVLENSLTVAERNLARLGEHERLREIRLFFQHALENEFRKVVEEILGRRTLAFISGLDTRRDVAIELFTLEPLAESSPNGD